MGVSSKNVNVCTKELRVFDPKSVKPDLIIELDNKYLIVEFQSTKVNIDFSKRGFVYVAILTQNKPKDKYVELAVLSTAEESKKVEFKYSEENTFKYNVISLDNLDDENIIANVKSKLEKNESIDSEEIVELSLIPLSKKSGNIEDNIEMILDILMDYNQTTGSQNALAFGILWLISDKFIKDPEKRKKICDQLGDKMSLLDEYGENKYNKGKKDGKKEGKEEGKEEGIEEIVVSLLKNGYEPETLSMKTNLSFEDVIEIKNKNNL